MYLLFNSFFMESLLLFQIIGPIFLVLGLGLLFNRSHYTKAWQEFWHEKDTPINVLSAMFMMVLGLLVVLNHNVWEWSVDVIPTIMGWGLVIKGAWWILCPRSLKMFLHAVSNQISAFMLVDGLLAVVVGGYLVYLGYFL